MIFMINRNENT
jgi:DNA-binding transcriptional LysR family regulator